MVNLHKYRVEIRGLRKLICHNAEQLADPTSELSQKMKEITGMKKKTLEHHKQLADLEWVGGMYVDEKKTPIIPFTVLNGMICEAAKKHKLGKDMKAGLEVIDSPNIVHDGPKNATLDDLISNPRFRDKRLVNVQRNKVMRTRPCFPVWSLSFHLQCDPEVVKEHELKAVLETGGRIIGLCDYRPVFGKFEVVSFKKVS